MENKNKESDIPENPFIALEAACQNPAVTNYPTPMNENAPVLSKEQKIAFITERFEGILKVLGLDLTDDSLQDTPNRIAKMYVNEIFSGLDVTDFPDISLFENKFRNRDKSGLVSVKAHFNSFCEHHFLPMIGEAHIAYIPKNKIIGLSKIPRIVRYFAKRPQVQERLTMQIADSLALLLETEDIAVSIKAQHFCVIARGIEDERSHTVTHTLRGIFDEDESYRRQFFQSIQR